MRAKSISVVMAPVDDSTLRVEIEVETDRDHPDRFMKVAIETEYRPYLKRLVPGGPLVDPLIQLVRDELNAMNASMRAMEDGRYVPDAPAPEDLLLPS